MSDQQTHPASGEAGALGAASAASDTPASLEAAGAVFGAEKAELAPDQEETSPKPDAPKADAAGMEAPKVEASKAEPPKVEAPKIEAPKIEAPKVEAPKIDVPKIDAVKAEAPPVPGNVMLMTPGERAGAAATASSGKRRFGAMAAVVALATVAGALGGALATAGFGKLIAADTAQASAQDTVFETSVARLDAEIVALKASLEHNSKATTGQINRASDRLDKVEKAQAEPAAKLAKLSETVDKLRATQAATTVAAAPAAAKDVTGSVPQPAVAAPATTPAALATTPAAPAKPDVARLPTVDGWILRDVANGGALIENRRGMYEVYAGDPVPGLGRVDAIRRQDGRWVVVTSKGLIVAR